MTAFPAPPPPPEFNVPVLLPPKLKVLTWESVRVLFAMNSAELNCDLHGTYLNRVWRRILERTDRSVRSKERRGHCVRQLILLELREIESRSWKKGNKYRKIEVLCQQRERKEKTL